DGAADLLNRRLENRERFFDELPRHPKRLKWATVLPLVDRRGCPISPGLLPVLPHLAWQGAGPLADMLGLARQGPRGRHATSGVIGR
ncbi:hypothetical protein, partial [Mycobacterium sp. E2462]|uniref:hypothetical protein n=1 Tax=Mycobacterium sp. E2462 TaxID=1834133 RepID=UPI0012E9C5DF